MKKSKYFNLTNMALLSFGILICTGCAIHYYDTETGAEHIFGIGHMVMKASSPKDNFQSIVRGTDIFGLGFGKNDDGGYLSLGWDKYLCKINLTF